MLVCVHKDERKEEWVGKRYDAWVWHRRKRHTSNPHHINATLSALLDFDAGFVVFSDDTTPTVFMESKNVLANYIALVLCTKICEELMNHTFGYASLGAILLLRTSITEEL